MAGGAQPRTRLPVRNPGGPPPHDRYALYIIHTRGIIDTNGYSLAAVCAPAVPRPAQGQRSASRPAGPSAGERRSGGGAVIATGSKRYLRTVNLAVPPA